MEEGKSFRGTGPRVPYYDITRLGLDRRKHHAHVEPVESHLLWWIHAPGEMQLQKLAVVVPEHLNTVKAHCTSEAQCLTHRSGLGSLRYTKFSHSVEPVDGPEPPGYEIPLEVFSSPDASASPSAPFPPCQEPPPTRSRSAMASSAPVVASKACIDRMAQHMVVAVSGTGQWDCSQLCL